jgi:hypothetical protein
VLGGGWRLDAGGQEAEKKIPKLLSNKLSSLPFFVSHFPISIIVLALFLPLPSFSSKSI